MKNICELFLLHGKNYRLYYVYRNPLDSNLLDFLLDPGLIKKNF